MKQSLFSSLVVLLSWFRRLKMSMDALLKADEQPFVSPIVNFRDFLYFAKRGSETLDEEDVTTQGSTWLCKNVIDSLLETIDVSDLRSKMFNTETDDGHERNQLVSQKILSEENSRRRNKQYRSIALRALRYDHVDPAALARKSPFISECRTKRKMERKPVAVSLSKAPKLDYSELIVSVSIYLGYTRELEYHEIRLGRLMKVTNRIEMTGEHSLEDLKNAFSCPADYAFNEDFSERTPTIDDIAKKKYPSNMFFIHDTFYVDENGREDLSENVRKWAARRRTVGEMHTLPMTTKLADLNARLGQPYVFVHQGVCEHLVVFNDLSLRDESHDDVVFPRRLVERNFRRVACDYCETTAKWMILEHDDMLPNSPGHACSDCFREFFFDRHGQKTGSFKAVPFCDRKEISDGGKFVSELRFDKNNN